MPGGTVRLCTQGDSPKPKCKSSNVFTSSTETWLCSCGSASSFLTRTFAALLHFPIHLHEVTEILVLDGMLSWKEAKICCAPPRLHFPPMHTSICALVLASMCAEGIKEDHEGGGVSRISFIFGASFSSRTVLSALVVLQRALIWATIAGSSSAYEVLVLTAKGLSTNWLSATWRGGLNTELMVSTSLWTFTDLAGRVVLCFNSCLDLRMVRMSIPTSLSLDSDDDEEEELEEEDEPFFFFEFTSIYSSLASISASCFSAASIAFCT